MIAALEPVADSTGIETTSTIHQLLQVYDPRDPALNTKAARLSLHQHV